MQKVATGLFTVLLLFFATIMPAWPGTFQDGLELVRHNHLNAAAQAFTHTIEKGEHLSAAYSNRCLINLKLEDYSAAIADCSSAISQTPNRSEAYLNRGVAHHRMARYADAIEDYDRLLSINRQDFRGYYNRGLSREALGKLDSAIDDFRMAERLSRQENSAVRSEIFNDWGLALFLQSEWTTAYAKFERAIRLTPQREGYYFNRGCTCHRLEHYSCALNDFTRVLQLNSQSADAYVSRGMIHAMLGEFRMAISDWSEAVNLFEEQHNWQAQQHIQQLVEQVTTSTSAIA